jgi:hypothetical protein
MREQRHQRLANKARVEAALKLDAAPPRETPPGKPPADKGGPVRAAAKLTVAEARRKYRDQQKGGSVPPADHLGLTGLLERSLQEVDRGPDTSETADAPRSGRLLASFGPSADDGGPQSSQFFLQNKVLSFPVVKDTDSMTYRAEAIRAFLEREMGLDRLLALRQAVASDGERVDDVLKDCEPGIVVLAQQLLVLEETLDDL